MFEIVTVVARNDISAFWTLRSVDLDRANVADFTFFSSEFFFVVETTHDALRRVESAVLACFLFHICELGRRFLEGNRQPFVRHLCSFAALSSMAHLAMSASGWSFSPQALRAVPCPRLAALKG